jgi:hypothetical protein
MQRRFQTADPSEMAETVFARLRLDLIKTVVGQFGGLSRGELAATVCELLGWTRAKGHPYFPECRYQGS